MQPVNENFLNLPDSINNKNYFEIERKFLLKTDAWRKEADKGTVIKQGYLNTQAERTVRVRIRGKQGFLTVKGKTNQATRLEFEYEIPLHDASQLLALCEQPLIEKTRFLVYDKDKTWEIDVFEGVNQGLIVAEIELQSESETFSIPTWLGAEVTQDARYYNSNLIKNPYCNWGKE